MGEKLEYYHPVSLAKGVHMKASVLNDYVRLETFVDLPFKFCAYVDLDEIDIQWLIDRLNIELVNLIKRKRLYKKQGEVKEE